ncbi:cobalt ECF transporter T component CbiQ [Sinirhodobacter ferrireducens]|uniref:Cobalt ECF transporter T component CbiQ n=1 Tax=Paenirhodobacter ferrireducens TaxID=1215032 RepID=A0A443LQ90_9RHOB|nr:cobalt ECF transporter T component CbiQ [Sinirhodobacter ferrireducens]RWR51344.1 cobalt ECF transporter T component CbiQ [Sinirhodobacter ferrireducens]
MIPADLRLRLLAAVLLVLAASQLAHLGPALAALALALILALAARPDRALWRRLRHVEGFVALLLLTLPFAVPGAPLLTLGPLSASLEGLARAALLAAKVTTAALVLLALLGTVEPIRLGAALHALRLPEPLVRLFVLTLRYLGLIGDEARRLREAMRARAFRARTDRHTWRSFGNLIGMLLVRALDRARRVEEAMRLRGFSGRFPHAALAAPTARDWTGFALLTGLAAAALLLDRL